MTVVALGCRCRECNGVFRYKKIPGGDGSKVLPIKHKVDGKLCPGMHFDVNIIEVIRKRK